jgi:hypothetical protein
LSVELALYGGITVCSSITAALALRYIRSSRRAPHKKLELPPPPPTENQILEGKTPYQNNGDIDLSTLALNLQTFLKEEN